MRTTAQLRKVWAPACTAPTVIRDLVPGIRISVDPRTTDAFAALGCVFQAHGYHVRREDTGSYNCRPITGGSGYSLHAYGIAVDANWNSNPYRRDRLVTDMPPTMIDAVLRIRTKGGAQVWSWGGDWDDDPDTEHSAYDAMHFQIVASPDELAEGIDWDTVDQHRDLADPSTWPALHPGDRGPSVKQLQYRLQITQDGVFGPITEAAVRDYQERHGLTVDGIVGLQTWTALLTDQPKVEPGEPGPIKKLPEPAVDVPFPSGTLETPDLTQVEARRQDRGGSDPREDRGSSGESMKARTRHALYWLAWAAAFGLYELYAYLNPAPGDSLSEQVWTVLMLDGIGPALTAMLAGFMAWLTFHLIGPAVWHHWKRWKDRRISLTQEAGMNGIGKYIRHIIAGLIGGVAAWASTRFGVPIDGEMQAALVVVVYAMVEKLLKRFRWLDAEGWAEREWAQEAAERTEPVTTEAASRKIRTGEV